MRILIAAGALLAVLQTPAAAFFDRDLNAPWCLEYSFHENMVECGYYSFRQCEATRSGVGGYCFENPRVTVVRRPGVRERRRY